MGITDESDDPFTNSSTVVPLYSFPIGFETLTLKNHMYYAGVLQLNDLNHKFLQFNLKLCYNRL